MRGNFLVSPEYCSTTDFLARTIRWIEPQNVVKRLNIPYYVKSATASSAKQLLSLYQESFESKYLEMGTNLVHIGSHINIYSYLGAEEYFKLDDVSQYSEHNAFIYLIKKNYIRSITWVTPDGYGPKEIADHFSAMDHYEKNGFHVISINQTLRIPVKVIPFSSFVPKQPFKFYSLVLSLNHAKFTSQDVAIFKQIGAL